MRRLPIVMSGLALLAVILTACGTKVPAEAPTKPPATAAPLVADSQDLATDSPESPLPTPTYTQDPPATIPEPEPPSPTSTDMLATDTPLPPPSPTATIEEARQEGEGEAQATLLYFFAAW